MKAYMEKSNTARLTGDGPYHGHPIRLTIGMIVKNEEKTLDRCLSSLKPLMDAVESELIITDTGSTDGTVEIAKKYTDRILHFEWCGDFSAARNTGLDAARGEWFLFLDGDEWFENTDDLIRFFTSGECDRYGSAAYRIRNYVDLNGEHFSITHALRASRVFPGIRFENAIHEGIRRLVPTKFLEDYANHDGYVYHSKEEMMEKFHRNMSFLEKEMRDHPENLKEYYQMGKEFFAIGEYQKSIEYSERGLEAEKKHPNRITRQSLLHNIAHSRFQMREYEQLLELTEDLLRTEKRREATLLDFQYYAQYAAFQLKRYGCSVRHGLEYLSLYDDIQAGRMDRDMLLFENQFFNTPAFHDVVIQMLVRAYPHLTAEESESFRLESVKPELFQSWMEQAAREENWDAFARLYRSGKACRMEPGWLAKWAEEALPEEAEKRAAAACAIAGIPEDGDPYVRLCRLRRAESEENREKARKELGWFSRWDGVWNPVLSDVLFSAMKEKVNLMPMILHIDSEDLKYHVAGMQKTHSDFPEVTRGYCETYSYENLRGLYWSVCLREKVLLSGGRAFETEEDEIEFFEAYARQTAQYVKILYHPELLVPDRVSMLPRAHRFGYYMGLAFSARDLGDGGTYLSNLRLALKAYSVMERQITLLLKQFEREEKLRRQKADEFRVLAKQVKERIQELIEQGDLKNAGQITSQLAALMPGDPDVVKFRTLTHTEPDMNELAAHLPQ
jgi:glycosyltransferase involved in cell wall biosynthesis